MIDRKGQVSMGGYKTKNSVSTVHALQRRTSMGGQKGVALAIVVWFIAGMSLLVAGIVSHARVDTQMAQLHVGRAKAVAAGDGAIQLMLADRLLKQGASANEQSLLSGVYELGSLEVLVMLFPAAELINVNEAPQAVLAALFLIGAQAAQGEANFLAESVVKWRKKYGRFREIEDLLQVDGMSRTVFEAVRGFVAAGERGSGVANWEASLAARMQLGDPKNSEELNELARHHEAVVGFAADGTQQDNDRSLSGSYRADALVTYGDKTWLRRRWLSTGSGRGSALPWHTVRTEPLRVYEE